MNAPRLLRPVLTIASILLVALALQLAGRGTSGSTEFSFTPPEDLRPLEEYRITIEDGTFIRNGTPIWLNGANTPWHIWDEFGGNIEGDGFDPAWWDQHFAAMASVGLNNTRVWISCEGDQGIRVNEDGTVLGPTDQFWTDLDGLMALAMKHRIYIMACLMSFDHTKTENVNHLRWRAMYHSDAGIDSFAENYAVPVVQRYADNPFLFSIDVCNEIVWVSDSENPDAGSIPWERLQRFVARVAQRVHETSDVLVTQSSYAKYTSPRFEGNRWSDEALQAQIDDPDAYLDFYKLHYYPWCYRWFGFHLEETPAELGLDDKPVIMGEISAHGVFAERAMGNSTETVHHMDLVQAYQLALENGWQGMQPWTSNGVDDNGDITDFAAVSRSLLELMPERIIP